MNVIYLLRGLLTAPSALFKEIGNGLYRRQVVSLFVMGSLITFMKSFHFERQTMNFYATKWINKIFSLLMIPQVEWVLCYVLHFIYIYVLYRCFRRLCSNNLDFEALLYSVLSVSALGVILQIMFLVISPFLLLPNYLIRIFDIASVTWAIILVFKAIRITCKISFIKSLPYFIFSSVIFVVLNGISVIAPSFRWLTTKVF